MSLERRLDMILNRKESNFHIGLGLEEFPGRPFGWAWHEERRLIREHLIRRGRYFGDDALAHARRESRISEIQRRIHREAPTTRERQAAWRARCEAALPAESGAFTPEELQRLVDLFGDANDPITASIGAKAAYRLQRDSEK